MRFERIACTIAKACQEREHRILFDKRIEVLEATLLKGNKTRRLDPCKRRRTVEAEHTLETILAQNHHLQHMAIA